MIPIESKLVSSCVQLWFMVPVAGVDLCCGAGRLRLQSAPGALPRAFGFDPCWTMQNLAAPMALRDFGAGGGGRTRTSLRTRDFESRASANSTTPAKLFYYNESPLQNQAVFATRKNCNILYNLDKKCRLCRLHQIPLPELRIFG